LVRWNCGIF